MLRGCRGVCVKRLTNRLGAWHKRRYNAFTILELLVVITIIIVLAGLILSTVGYVQKKGARSRAEAEMAAMSAALESYKADNGIYPRDIANQTTDKLDARSPNASDYAPASLYLYTQLSGNSANRKPTPNSKSYFAFKPNMLTPRDESLNVTAIVDPFGNSYGYSTIYQADPSKGYNPTFDLWSTANSVNQVEWIKNW
jgi:type II secretory pathway pseudopilin PulG